MTLNSDVFREGSSGFHRWCEIGALILVLHVGGGIAATVHWPKKIDPAPSGAIVMELSALAVAPPRTEVAAVGPLTEEAVSSLQPLEETVPEISEFPELEQSPLAPDPEVALPVAEPLERLQEAEPEETLQEAQPGVELTAATTVAMAPPKMEVLEAETVSAQSLGAISQPSPAEISWQKEMLFHLSRHKRYPAHARKRGVEGVVKVEFRVGADGRLVDARLIRGSGSQALDEEALSVLQRASPFPQPPDCPPGDHVALVLPIEFLIRR